MQAAYWIALMMCLAPGFCCAQKLKPCRVPPLYTGKMHLATQDEQLRGVYAYAYDAVNKRIHILYNETYSYEALILYKKRVMYSINSTDQTCVRLKVKSKFHPMEVPKDTNFLSQVVLGTSSQPGQGLVVNLWDIGHMSDNNGTCLMTYTNGLCLPVSVRVHVKDKGWSLSFYDNILGADPKEFIPPPSCKDAKLDGEKADFFSIFN